jgi:hypothetical protein
MAMSTFQFQAPTNAKPGSRREVSSQHMPARAFFFIFVEEVGKDGFLVRKVYASCMVRCVFEIVQLHQLSICRAAQDDLPAALHVPFQQRVERILPARGRPIDNVAVVATADGELRGEMAA